MIDLKKIAKNREVLLRKIEAQRDAITAKIKRLRREDPMTTTDRSIIVEPGTDAGVLFGHEQVVIFEQRLKSDLKEIEKALLKIKKGTYGKCEKCGRPIEARRLEAKPSAIYCLEDKKKLEARR